MYASVFARQMRTRILSHYLCQRLKQSRAIFTRFIAPRSRYTCRTLDFISFKASLTLLLAHLDSHHPGTQNILAHQYHSDRAMIEQVKHCTEEFNRAKSDPLSSQIAEWLARLAAIEAETSNI